MRRVVVIGGDGVIGSALREELARRGVACVWTSRRGGDAGALGLDLEADPAGWPSLPEADAAFVCAGMTKLAGCAAEPDRAWLVNVERTALLTGLLAARSGVVVNLSTSQVFDGTRAAPGEGEAVSPVSGYGRVKAAMESAVREAAPGGLVARIVKVFGAPPNLWSGWRRELGAGRSIEAFADLVIAPLRRPVAARLLLDVAAARARGELGPVAHLTAARDESYHRLALRLAAVMGVDPGLVGRASAEAQGMPAEHRPACTTLGRSTMDRVGETPPDPLDAVVEAAGVDV
ncbi:MAG: sugar nucleotide-binding protein [Planctomycetota bacterium]